MYEGKKILVGLSGGINSMAVLCWLYESGQLPGELHLFYAHFAEHSPDTFRFVADGIRFARRCFPCVKVRITRNSVLEYFERHKMIPHPSRSTCSYHLKIKPMEDYCLQQGIELDLVGFVRSETKRINRMSASQLSDAAITKTFPIRIFDNEWCFQVVDRHIGWHPAIYDIVDEGQRVFTHNNCLPCKNMRIHQLQAVDKHYPAYMANAHALSGRLKAYWGRNAQDYYTAFGREDYEPQQCEVCRFD